MNLIVNIYWKEILEPELRPEFTRELLEAQKEKIVKVNDFSKYYR